MNGGIGVTLKNCNADPGEGVGAAAAPGVIGGWMDGFDTSGQAVSVGGRELTVDRDNVVGQGSNGIN